MASFRCCRSHRVPATLFHAITAAIYRNHLGVMKQPVEQCAGKNLIPEQATPLGEARIGGEQNRAVLIACGTLINILQNSIIHSANSFK